jgi:hypothetical protein
MNPSPEGHPEKAKFLGTILGRRYIGDISGSG